MMKQILVADNPARDAQELRAWIEDPDRSIELCSSGAELAIRLASKREWAAIMILWELPGPPFGPELLARSRHLRPGVPIVVVSDALDATLATRAFTLGASDFLQKPLDGDRVKSCLNSLLVDRVSNSELVERLNERILGKSTALLSTLQHLAKAIDHDTARVLLIGDSGTGKELLAQAFHDFSSKPKAPFVAVNVAAVPKELVESALFGHEKGAFTGATDAHKGYLEESDEGTLFLDEIGELDLSLQAKILRAFQERKFRRLKGSTELDFKARLVCATNRDLALAVKQGGFRQDLFHRINEVTIQVPPLRARIDDLELLLEYFLKVHGGDRQVAFARETLTILKSYPFPGNIRELENFVKRALIECDGSLILPQHLPLPTMGVFLEHEDLPAPAVSGSTSGRENAAEHANEYQELFTELIKTLSKNWDNLPYKQVLEQYQRAFDRVYFQRLIERYRHNVTRAAKAAGVDKKTFAQHWKVAGLPPLRPEDEESMNELVESTGKDSGRN
jgi:DNA-binding NtrC family response regulator